MNASTESSTVLVTGGSGYLAGWIVISLLEAGHKVRTTIRDITRGDAVRSTLERYTRTDGLTFRGANLLSDEGWVAATRGVDHVIHVASPMPVREYRNQDLVTPAREGTRRVLQAALRAGVRHVVMTSSTVAASALGGAQAPTDETVWTDLANKSLGPYPRSKTLAEQDAWSFVRSSSDDLTLTTILPGLVLGPVLGPDLSGSLELPQRMLNGRLPLLPRISFAGVHTRDVAELHVRALTDPRARMKRIIAASNSLWLKEMAIVLKGRLGAKGARVSTREAPDWLIRAAAIIRPEARFMASNLGKQQLFSSAIAEDILGRPLRSMEEALLAAAESILAGRAT